MTITQLADTSGAYAGMRVGPGITLGFYRSGLTPPGGHVAVTILYSFGGTIFTVCFGSGFATPGTAMLSGVTFYGGGTGVFNVGVPDGAGVSVAVSYSATGVGFLEAQTFTGYTWDAVSGLQNLLGSGGGTAIAAILNAVTRTYSTP